jgi:surface carbohydrate biosynthesis protein
MNWPRRTRNALGILVRRQFEVSWQMPKAVDLVIWDEVGSQFLLDAIEPESYYILKTRNNSIFLHPLIVWETLVSALTKRNTHHGVVIKRCHPKTVVTFIDNNLRFHKLANRLPDIRFVAIQNGQRDAFPDESQAIGPPAIYDSEYLCFSQCEIDSYRSIGYKFKHINGMGSLKNALFVRHLYDSKRGINMSGKGDILLISQYRKMNPEWEFDMSMTQYNTVLNVLRLYLESHPGLQVSVALACTPDQSDYEAERLFHQEHLGNLATLIPKSEDWMSAYYLTGQFSVVVAASSTLGFETLARGRKTLMCDVRLLRNFVDQAVTPDWILSRLDQETFDDACTKLFAMPLEDFVLRNRKSINYFMLSPHENSITEFQRNIVG